MLKRSNIVAAEEDLQAFYRDLEAHSLAALWTQGGGATEPRSKAVPFVWHWRDAAAPGHTGRRAGGHRAGRAPGAPSSPTRACRSRSATNT